MIDFNSDSVIKLTIDRKPKISGVEEILVPGESIVSTYSTIRDYVVFTDKRIISVNVQGVTGKKKDFTTLPYSRIQLFSIETSGVFDMDSELELYFSSLGKVRFAFSGFSDIKAIGQAISAYLLK